MHNDKFSVFLARDMVTLEGADALVINGGGMEQFMDKVISLRADLPVIDASEGIEMFPSDEEHDHDAHGHDDHDELYNAHVWLDPNRAMIQVQNIAAGLAEADPEHAEAYQKNAESYIARLTALNAELAEQLAPFAGAEIITFHEAFPYFAEEFDLHIVKVVNREPDSQPSAKELADTIRLIESTDVKAVFAEPQYSTDAAQIIAQESGATVYLLDPVVTGENDKDAYLRAMEQNMEVLKEALGGA